MPVDQFEKVNQKWKYSNERTSELSWQKVEAAAMGSSQQKIGPRADSNNSTCSFWLACVFLSNLHAFLQHISERVSVESVINKWKSSCHFAWRNGLIAGCLFILQIKQWHWTWKAFLSIKNYFYQHQNSTIIINGESKTY